ncbi:hypothetical protein [Roseateles sp. PN1]|uniref:hypothetical protein n=1 Tax=Roseateles sp. PN1 TaxID=3137372 RepID=UPI0031399228
MELTNLRNINSALNQRISNYIQNEMNLTGQIHALTMQRTELEQQLQICRTDLRLLKEATPKDVQQLHSELSNLRATNSNLSARLNGYEKKEKEQEAQTKAAADKEQRQAEAKKHAAEVSSTPAAKAPSSSRKGLLVLFYIGCAFIAGSVYYLL